MVTIAVIREINIMMIIHQTGITAETMAVLREARIMMTIIKHKPRTWSVI